MTVKPSDQERLAACLAEIKTRYISEGRAFEDICAVDKAYRLAEKVLLNHRRGLNFLAYGEESRYTKEKARELARDLGDLPPAA